MRNLVALCRKSSRFDETETTINAFTINITEKYVYFLTSTGRISVLSIEEDASVKVLCHLSDVVKTSYGVVAHCWKWINYIGELDSVVCASICGEIAVVDVQTGAGEDVGVMDGGIVGLAWSNNQEMVAIITGKGAVLVMNTNWEVLYEIQIQVHLPSPVAFLHGTIVQACWRDDAQYLVLNIPITSTTSSETTIESKVLVFSNELALHAIGRLEDGREIPHLGDAATWCPDHSLIASYERRKDAVWIVFFERNGLRHGQFKISTASTTRVHSVGWNISSDILAVHLEDETSSTLQLWTRNNYHWYLKQTIAYGGLIPQRILCFSWDDEVANRIHILTPSSYEYIEFVWDVSSRERQISTFDSTSVAAVIDGSRLQLTALHHALIPPPMSYCTLEFPSAVNSIAFDAQDENLAVLLSSGKVMVVEHYLSSEPTFIVAHHDPLLTSLVSFRSRVKNESMQYTFAAKSGEKDMLSLFMIEGYDLTVFVLSEDLIGVHRVTDSSVSASTFEVDLTPLSQMMSVQLHDGRMCTVRWPFFCQALTEVKVNFEQTVMCPFVRFQVIAVDNAESDSWRLLYVGLSCTGRLYVNAIPVTTASSPRCSSFHFCGMTSVLMYTTATSASAQLCLLPLNALIKKLEDPSIQLTMDTRALERGSRIVSVLGDRASVVLQMPRGNLEGIAPRLLVLALVIQMIERLEFVAALECCRRHRVDMNVLVDFSPNLFYTNLKAHLIEVYMKTKSPRVTSDRLCLFITNLHVDDVWKAKYGPQLSKYRPVEEEKKEKTAVDKVTSICQAMMTTMSSINDSILDNDALLLPYLTCTMKQTPPNYMAALEKVQHLLTHSSQLKHAKRAVRHLIFLTQVDTLFNEALGLYDLKLVRFIATYSQRDPKEYVPFLDTLTALACEDERQYRIDIHLERYASALQHLSRFNDKCNDDYQKLVMDVVTKGALFDQALSLFPRKTYEHIHTCILSLKAAALVKQEQYADAAKVYLTVQNYHDAMQAFRMSRNWRMALTIAAKANLLTVAFGYEVAQTLRNQPQGQLVAISDIVASAQVYADYCDDVDEAIALLVEHKQWDEALRVAHVHKRCDLIETEIEVAIGQTYDSLLEDIGERTSEYIKHWTRLSTIREQKRLFRLHGIDGSRWEQGEDGIYKEDDQSIIASSAVDSALSCASSLRSVGSHNRVSNLGNFAMKSLVTSTSSHFYATIQQQQTLSGRSIAASSTSTSSTAKSNNRFNGMPSRRDRRRRVQQGSPEEEAYVAQQLIANAPSQALKREVADVLSILVYFGCLTQAETLQQALSDFEKLIENKYPLLTVNDKVTSFDVKEWKFAGICTK